MKERKTSRLEKITNQLEMIDNINKLIEISKKMNSELMIRQHEHLKKKYTKNLFKMLAESYHITVPSLEAA